MVENALATLPDISNAGALVLHRRRLSDVPELLAAIEASIGELSAFLRWAANGPPSSTDLERIVAARLSAFDTGIAFDYVVRESSNSQVVGEIGGQLNASGETAEIGYWTRTGKTGLGYATMAARSLTSLLFNFVGGLEHIELRMDGGNIRSRSVADRLGFVHIGYETFAEERLSGQTGTGLIYAISRNDWRMAT